MNPVLINVISSIFVSLVLHEYGHYVAARLCKVPVTEAGLGWGWRLFGVRVRNLQIQLRLLPVGAYVRMDMAALQQRPLMQQLFVLGAGIGVNLILALFTWGTFFGVVNLALAIGNLLPLYQHDGWKGGMLICRKIFRGSSPAVEWSFTLSGGLLALILLVRAILLFQN